MADQDASCGCAAKNGKLVFISRKYLANVFFLLLFVKTDASASKSILLGVENETLDVQSEGTHQDSSSLVRKSFAFYSSDHLRDTPNSRSVAEISSEKYVSPTFYLSSFGISSGQSEVAKTVSLVQSSITGSISSKEIHSNESTLALSTIPPYTTNLPSTASTISESILESPTPVYPSSSICISVITISSLCEHSSSTFLLNSSAVKNITNSTVFSSIQVSPSTVIMSNFTTLATTIMTSQLGVNLSTAVIPSILSQVNLSTAIEPSTSQINISSSAIMQSAYIIIPASKYHKCDHIAANFSEALSNYTMCVLSNLKPMEVCFKCFKEYDAMREHHRSIYQDCKKKLITSYNHKYQVISQLFDLQQQTWNSLECKKCYNYDTQPPQPTSAFLQFQKMHKNTIECFRNNTHHGNHNATNNATSDVCTNCKSIYSELQLKYKFQEDSAESESETSWCADINVVVNDTRHRWSKVYKCGKKEKDMISIIALTCFFCFLPVVFYVGAKLHSDVKERKTNRYYESE